MSNLIGFTAGLAVPSTGFSIATPRAVFSFARGKLRTSLQSDPRPSLEYFHQHVPYAFVRYEQTLAGVVRHERCPDSDNFCPYDIRIHSRTAPTTFLPLRGPHSEECAHVKFHSSLCLGTILHRSLSHDAGGFRPLLRYGTILVWRIAVVR